MLNPISNHRLKNCLYRPSFSWINKITVRRDDSGRAGLIGRKLEIKGDGDKNVILAWVSRQTRPTISQDTKKNIGSQKDVCCPKTRFFSEHPIFDRTFSYIPISGSAITGPQNCIRSQAACTVRLPACSISRERRFAFLTAESARNSFDAQKTQIIANLGRKRQGCRFRRKLHNHEGQWTLG